MDRDELKAAGNLGLVQAANRYQDQGKSFETYASRCIVGEMADLDRDLRWGKIHSRLTVVELNENHDKAITSRNCEVFYDTITSPLDDFARKVFVLYYRDGYTLDEISEILQAGKWGKSRLSQILTKSETLIRESYESHELFALL
jgi:RNA polymerase sigma factor (sigma-70 family)